MIYVKQLLLVMLSLVLASTTAFLNTHSTPSRLFMQNNAFLTTQTMAKTYTVMDPVTLNQKKRNRNSTSVATRQTKPLTKGKHATKRFSGIVKIGIVSGAHIGIASYISILINCMYPQKSFASAIVLPFGVLMSLFTSGELFTKQTALLAVRSRSRK